MSSIRVTVKGDNWTQTILAKFLLSLAYLSFVFPLICHSSLCMYLCMQVCTYLFFYFLVSIKITSLFFFTCKKPNKGILLIEWYSIEYSNTLDCRLSVLTALWGQYGRETWLPASTCWFVFRLPFCTGTLMTKTPELTDYSRAEQGKRTT